MFILMTITLGIFSEIVLQWMGQDLIDDRSTLVQVVD